jgi:hypothetical protein
MTADAGQADDDLRAEIARAFRELRPAMIADARKDADLDPASRMSEFRDEDLEQFANAYEAMFMEALDGTGRQTRDFVLDTALPPVLESGGSVLDLIRGNVVSAVMLTHRLLPLIAPEHRDGAARWLAAFQSSYTYEMAERGLAHEADGS